MNSAQLLINLLTTNWCILFYCSLCFDVKIISTYSILQWPWVWSLAARNRSTFKKLSCIDYLGILARQIDTENPSRGRIFTWDTYQISQALICFERSVAIHIRANTESNAWISSHRWIRCWQGYSIPDCHSWATWLVRAKLKEEYHCNYCL